MGCVGMEELCNYQAIVCNDCKGWVRKSVLGVMISIWDLPSTLGWMINSQMDFKGSRSWRKSGGKSILGGGGESAAFFKK